MPFVMEYTDENDTTYPESYWIIRYYSANDPARTGTIHFFGFSSIEKFDVIPESVGIGNRQYQVTDPAVFDAYFGKAGLVNAFAYLTILETMALAIDDFFATASQLSQLKPQGAELGSQGTSRLIITFPAAVEIQPTGNLESGMHIYINSIEATINAASRNGPHTEVYYDLDEEAGPADVVTWAYDAVNGFLEDAGGLALQSYLNKTVLNTVGEYWQFDEASNSGQFAIHF